MCKYTDVCNCTQYCVNIQLVKGSYPKKSYKGLIWQTKQKPPPTSTSPIQQTHCQFGSKPISIKCQFPQQSCGRTKYQWVGHDNNSPIRDKYTNPMPIWPIQYHILATYQPQVQKKLSIIDRSANPPPIHIPIPANASVKCKNTLNTLANGHLHWLVLGQDWLWIVR